MVKPQFEIGEKVICCVNNQHLNNIGKIYTVKSYELRKDPNSKWGPWIVHFEEAAPHSISNAEFHYRKLTPLEKAML